MFSFPMLNSRCIETVLSIDACLSLDTVCFVLVVLAVGTAANI